MLTRTGLLRSLVKFIIVSVFVSLFVSPQQAFAAQYLDDTDHGGANWTLSNGDVIAGNHTNIAIFTIPAGATVTVSAYTGAAYGTVQITANSVDIQGTLSADGKGYTGGTNPGAGPGGGTQSGSDYGGGAGYGGIGGSVGIDGNGDRISAGGPIYGSSTAPTHMGSQGSTGWGSTGGAGGGAIKITSTTSTSITGSITSNGAQGTEASYGAGGGGSGGSVYIITSTLSGNGTITTNGANTTNNKSAAGGGGRIAIKYSSSSTFSGTLTSNLGSAPFAPAPENGTAVIIDTGNNDLYITTSQPWSATSSADGATHTYRNISVSNNATWTLKGFSSNDTNGVGFTFNVTNFTVATGSAVSSSGWGYPGGDKNGINGHGTGYGKRTQNDNGGGGGYGGAGGGGVDGGTTYGSSTIPIDLGSGGARGYSVCKTGGSGGGAIKVSATDTITVDGSINSEGGVALANPCTYGIGGAGSGGSVYLISNTFAGAGSLSAKGGLNTNTQYSGGGGRVAYRFAVKTFSGTVDVTGGGGASGGTDGSESSQGIPGAPTSLTQYASDGTTVVTVGSNLNESTMVVKMSMVHGNLSATLTPEVEIKQIGTSFTNFPTATGAGVAYSGSPVTGSITLSSLVDLATYHWQARVCDTNSNCSSWASYGGNAESATDVTIVLNTPPNAPTLSAAYTDDSYDNDSTPSLVFTLSDSDEANTIKYQIQISVNSDYSSPVVDYTSDLQIQGQKTFTVGQAVGSGIYTTGFQGQTLANGNYYWRVRAQDSADAYSSYSPASLLTSAFRIYLANPEVNATSITGITSGNWISTEPTLSWTAGSDSGSGLLGYCISLTEYAPGASPSTTNPAADAGVLTGIDDGVTSTDCPFIVTTTSVNFSSIAGLTLTTNKQYYFSIKAINNAGNTFTDADTATYSNLINFKYDITAPTNVNAISGAGGSFSNVGDMYFNWPTNQATDAASGLLGFQYSINDQDSWTGDLTDATTGLNYVDITETQPHYLSAVNDASQVIVGSNTIYFRTVDVAGNFSSAETYRTTLVSYGGAAPIFLGNASVTVTPSTNTANSYALSWSTASPSSGRTIDNYYYMINTTPPATYATLTGNSALYIPTSATSIAASSLPGVVRGSNTVYIVVADDLENYSPSNYVSTTFTLNSENPDPPLNLVAADSSLKASSLWRGSLAWDIPAYTGTGSLSYFVQRSTDGITWSAVATTSGTAYVDTVSTSSLYYWRVASTDSSDLSKQSPSWANAVSLTPKGSYTSAADLSSGPTVSDITTKKAKISWSTGRNSDSKVAYGTKSGTYNTEEPSSSSQVTDHVINLTNLSPGTKYYYVAKWTDEDGNTGTSTEKDFTSASAPTAKDVSVVNIGLDTALIKFTTNNASKAKVYYGTTTSFGAYSEMSTSTSESSYSLLLTGLTDGTKYYYKINLFDSDSSEYDNITLDFTTLPRPKISSVQIQQVANTSQSTLYITWKSNTEISSIVNFYPEGSTTEARDEVEVALVKDHQIIVRSLLPDTTYILQIKGRDKIGNEASSERITFTTATDTRPPQVLDVRAEGGEVIPASNDQDVVSQLIVSWTTDEPSTSQVEFGEGTGLDYPQKTQEDSNLTLNHMVIISNLSPSKVYHLRAISKDKADNEGVSLDLVTITPKITDSAFGLVITNLQEAFGFLGGF